jgi:hypothetical protein
MENMVAVVFWYAIGMFYVKVSTTREGSVEVD